MALVILKIFACLVRVVSSHKSGQLSHHSRLIPVKERPVPIEKGSG
jgi:hypothetical protein